MSEMQVDQAVSTGRRTRRARRSDGHDPKPIAPMAPAQGTVKQGTVNTPGAVNSALKEPAPAPEDGVDPNHPCAAHVTILDRENAYIQTDRKKIAICGFASSTRQMIPIDDPQWEVWGMNQLYRHVKRADRWFDVHWNWNQELVPGTDHHGWIRDSGIPVYMTQTHADMPTTVRFPLQTLTEWFSADYFTSTVAHMSALAIWEIDRRVAMQLRDEPVGTALEGLQRARQLYAEYTIGYFGIDLIVGEEYGWQKPCAEFWIGAAAIGRGIEVYTPPQSALCKQRFRYGYETEPPTIVKPAELEKHKALMQAEKEKLLKHAYMLDGAIQADDYWHELIELRLRGGDIKT
jgi:hypothetical protein